MQGDSGSLHFTARNAALSRSYSARGIMRFDVAVCFCKIITGGLDPVGTFLVVQSRATFGTTMTGYGVQRHRLSLMRNHLVPSFLVHRITLA
jgi:hypothetical protein